MAVWPALLYAYGSTWTSTYEQMIYQFTEAAGGELPPVEVLRVPRAPYDLVKVNGRLMIPFVLARSTGEVADEPTLTSEILRVTTVPFQAALGPCLDRLGRRSVRAMNHATSKIALRAH